VTAVPRSRTEIIVILGVLTALAPLSIDMYLPSLPELARVFAADPAQVQRTLATFFLGFALGQAFYGPVADRWGRKPPLYLSLLLFALASAGCALAPSVSALMGWRFLQALGACAGGVVARAMVRDLFDPKESIRIFASLMLVMGVAPMLAPILGGALLLAFGWSSVFWFLALVGLVCLALVHLRLPESRVPHTAVARGLGGVLLAYGRLLRDRHFMCYTLAGGFGTAALFTYIAGSPFVLIELHGVPPEHFGWYFGVNALGLVGAAQINGRLLHGRDSTKVIMVAQMVQAAAGAVLLLNAATGFGGLAGIVAPLFLFVSCLGFTSPSSTALAMAPQGANAGTASAMLGTLQFSMAALSSSLLGALQNGTAIPMAVVMLGGALAAMASLHLLRKKDQAA
jgi:drug resistance transporter, Bcr/CflA subfamily